MFRFRSALLFLCWRTLLVRSANVLSIIGGRSVNIARECYGTMVDARKVGLYAQHGKCLAERRRRSPLQGDGLVLKVRDMPLSFWATAKLRRAGAKSAVVTVDGRKPIILTLGSISCGRLFLRCKTVPVELGAAKGGSLVLGERVFINTGATVVATQNIVLGDDCLIGDFVAIFDTDFHQLEPSRPTRVGPVRLGSNVWVGRSSTILPGVSIGDHAVIAAGSVVTDNVAAKLVVAGIPARPVRTLDIPDGWRRK